MQNTHTQKKGKYLNITDQKKKGRKTIMLYFSSPLGGGTRKTPCDAIQEPGSINSRRYIFWGKIWKKKTGPCNGEYLSTYVNFARVHFLTGAL